MVTRVDREQVLAYRVAAHELTREVRRPDELAAFALGLLDTPYGAARLALAARLAADVDLPSGLAAGDDPDFPLVWSFRGAPHLHRRTDLAPLAEALWPRTDEGAVARLAAERKAFKAAGITGQEAFRTAATAMRAVAGTRLSKGDLSAAVTARLPAAYSYECRGCQATHVYGGLFQQVGLFAGVRVAGTSPTMLAPLTDRYPVPRKARGTEALARTYLRLHGPATARDFAGYLGTNPTEITPAWPDDLAEVSIDGKRAWIPEEHLAMLQAAEKPRMVRLLTHADPYLQGRDRDLLVPDREHQKALWRILGSPGAVMIDGEVAGVWRAKLAGKRRLDVTVTPFSPLPARQRRAVETEARLVATARGATDVRVIDSH